MLTIQLSSTDSFDLGGPSNPFPGCRINMTLPSRASIAVNRFLEPSRAQRNPNTGRDQFDSHRAAARIVLREPPHLPGDFPVPGPRTNNRWLRPRRPVGSPGSGLQIESVKNFECSIRFPEARRPLCSFRYGSRATGFTEFPVLLVLKCICTLRGKSDPRPERRVGRRVLFG